MTEDLSHANWRERQAISRSEEILDAAAALFAARGFHRTTTRDIADAAGVAEGTLYNYFNSKNDLLLGIMRRLTNSLVGLSMQTETVTSSARDHFAALMRVQREFQEQNATMLQALLSEILADAELRARYYHLLIQPTLMALEKDLELHTRLKQIRPTDIPATARILASIFIGLFFLEVLGDPGLETGEVGLEEAFVGLTFDGIAPR